mmetsp:Transcript_83276/g.185069  ORF Transcript_83276/g.185069 Transcript_83276/m.185069 type:complete len:213 (+) Transcript_83276:282-920(+)
MHTLVAIHNFASAAASVDRSHIPLHQRVDTDRRVLANANAEEASDGSSSPHLRQPVTLPMPVPLSVPSGALHRRRDSGPEDGLRLGVEEVDGGRRPRIQNCAAQRSHHEAALATVRVAPVGSLQAGRLVGADYHLIGAPIRVHQLWGAVEHLVLLGALVANKAEKAHGDAGEYAKKQQQSMPPAMPDSPCRALHKGHRCGGRRSRAKRLCDL